MTFLQQRVHALLFNRSLFFSVFSFHPQLRLRLQKRVLSHFYALTSRMMHYPILTISAVVGFSRRSPERLYPRRASSAWSVSEGMSLSESDILPLLSDSVINAIDSTAALASA